MRSQAEPRNKKFISDLSFSRSQVLPGNPVLEALPPL